MIIWIWQSAVPYLWHSQFILLQKLSKNRKSKRQAFFLGYVYAKQFRFLTLERSLCKIEFIIFEFWIQSFFALLLTLVGEFFSLYAFSIPGLQNFKTKLHWEWSWREYFLNKGKQCYIIEMNWIILLFVLKTLIRLPFVINQTFLFIFLWHWRRHISFVTAKALLTIRN